SEDESVLASPPEALTLAWKRAECPSTKKVYLYPDPPLTEPELKVLTNLQPEAEFLTPFMKMARKGCPPAIKTIAVSTSVSNDQERFGLSPPPGEAIFDETHTSSLRAGLQTPSGGPLQAIPPRGTNFTLRLFELVRAYSRLTPDLPTGPLKPILNIAPWPLRL